MKQLMDKKHELVVEINKTNFMIKNLEQTINLVPTLSNQTRSELMEELQTQVEKAQKYQIEIETLEKQLQIEKDKMVFGMATSPIQLKDILPLFSTLGNQSYIEVENPSENSSVNSIIYGYGYSSFIMELAKLEEQQRKDLLESKVVNIELSSDYESFDANVSFHLLY